MTGACAADGASNMDADTDGGGGLATPPESRRAQEPVCSRADA